MKRVMLVALLVIGLPTAALASGIDFTTGTFASGTFSGSFTTSLNVSVTGSMNTISITTGPLTSVASGVYTFTSGSVTVSSGGTTIFTDTFAGTGTVNVNTVSGTTTVGIQGALSPFTFHGRTIANGMANLQLQLQGNTVTFGDGSVLLATPEPGTLGLLGTGLIGLAGLTRRKLKRL